MAQADLNNRETLTLDKPFRAKGDLFGQGLRGFRGIIRYLP